jgi:hypothetical protein
MPTGDIVPRIALPDPSVVRVANQEVCKVVHHTLSPNVTAQHAAFPNHTVGGRPYPYHRVPPH